MRVLVVRVGAMGDVLHALPAVAALRRARPEWEIGWAVDARWAPLLESARGARPVVDRVHLTETGQWKRAPISMETGRSVARLRREMRAGKYDVAVDMQGTIRSGVIGQMAGAGGVAGYADPREGVAGWMYGRRWQRRGAHVVEQGCGLLGEAVGVELVPGLVELPVDARAEMWADGVLAGVGRFCLIAPTAGWGAKMWPAERFGQVARELAGAGYRVLVNAAGAQDGVAAEVVRASDGRAEAVVSTVAEMTALVRRASVVIAGDTGPLHLGAALGRPVVGLFGPTDPARNGPFGTRARVLRSPVSVTDYRRTAPTEAGLMEIGAEVVVGAAMEMLNPV